MVNWYIDLLEAGSKKYIVPHNQQHLELIKDQLGTCHKTIMNFKIVTHQERPLFDINYPKGYER